MVRYGQVWPDWPGIARYGQISRDIRRYGQIRPDILRSGQIRADMARYGQIQPDMARYSQICIDTMWPGKTVEAVKAAVARKETKTTKSA